MTYLAWEKIYKADDDMIVVSALRNGLFAEFFPENDSVHLESFERREWLKKLFDTTDLLNLSRREGRS